MEPENSGMHTTNSVDVGIVLGGEIVLELDDGVEVMLRTGDMVVQIGTRHRWHNRRSIPSCWLTGRVHLIGRPGTGKSTITRQLGVRLGAHAVEVDPDCLRSGWHEADAC
jgi:hypothetical protein